jgi:hypothetical protein
VPHSSACTGRQARANHNDRDGLIEVHWSRGVRWAVLDRFVEGFEQAADCSRSISGVGYEEVVGERGSRAPYVEDAV